MHHHYRWVCLLSLDHKHGIQLPQNCGYVNSSHFLLSDLHFCFLYERLSVCVLSRACLLNSSPYFASKAACASAAAYCKQKDKNISKLALQFALKNRDIATTLVGMNSVEQVKVLCTMQFEHVHEIFRTNASKIKGELNYANINCFFSIIFLASFASWLELIWFSSMSDRYERMLGLPLKSSRTKVQISSYWKRSMLFLRQLKTSLGRVAKKKTIEISQHILHHLN